MKGGWCGDDRGGHNGFSLGLGCYVAAGVLVVV